ncbi:ARM repeat-containing protein [Rickenella mellea]|uniref:Importin-13 n=1 Tax=Rickenella mellea TaxID=50990 RepID=A0A4Y7QIL4_9AGAM|nr:ARM repeat-containing protein [Rickenella mellea]
MNVSTLFPTLSHADVEQAALLIQTAYTPGHSPEYQRSLQHNLFEIQKRPEAWGLVLPFLEHPDPNVQFFGAHTAQVKIARDWDAFPQDNANELRDFLLEVTGRLAAAGRSKVTLRKLFVAISSLALKLVPGSPSKWPDWIVQSVTSLSASGASAENILDFLAIVAEEAESSDLLPPNKAQLRQSLTDAIPLMNEAVLSSITRSNASSNEINAALKCFEVWVPSLRGSDLTSIIPNLIHLLSNESAFVATSDVLQEILTKSSLTDGAGTKTVTEPLLDYLSREGAVIVEQTTTNGIVDEVSHSLCKLLVALGEHSIHYFAANISHPPIQNFLKLILSYTALPGYYGIDEEESEMTLSFWYLLQEAMWSVDFVTDRTHTTENQWVVANGLYTELVATLKRKVTWPNQTQLSSWNKDQRDKFQVYRRDVGDTLINAYYILRDKMLNGCVSELQHLLSTRHEQDGWETIEAILHCVMSVQEAVPILESRDLVELFGPDILGRLPTTGRDRVRRTSLGLIGAYATWFTTQQDPALLMGVLTYVVHGLSEPSLCLQAANALRDLCDANRTALASHIGAFGQLHASLPSIPDSEKTKVIQSISSVIQALPPDEEVQPVEAIVSPVVAKLSEALNSASQLPEEARAVAILQLQTLTGCAKGLTRATDVLFTLDESPSTQEEVDRMKRTREDPRMEKLRDAIIQGIRGTMELWSNDATTGDALSELVKSITALPSDMTLLSLPPGPLLELVCAVVQRHVNAVWLSLASMLVLQLDPPSLFTLKSVPSAESEVTVTNVLPMLLQASLQYLSQEGVMEANPDVVQAFFGCMDMIAQHFTAVFFRLPSIAFDALIQCAIRALSLQERYSLVSACTFLGTLINRTIPNEDLAPHGRAFIDVHGKATMRAILLGFAGLAPASTTQNLIELLSVLVSKCPNESKAWMPEILFSDDFVQSKATVAAKEKFVKAVLSAKSIKRTRDAAQQFTLVAKGLEGSSFGYASVTM